MTILMIFYDNGYGANGQSFSLSINIYAFKRRDG